VDARHNWWGYNETLAVAGRIRDRGDSPELLQVDYQPFQMNNKSVLSGKCPPAWDLVGDTCYILIGAPMDFYSARDFCRVSYQIYIYNIEFSIIKFLLLFFNQIVMLYFNFIFYYIILYFIFYLLHLIISSRQMHRCRLLWEIMWRFGNSRKNNRNDSIIRNVYGYSN